MLTCYPVLFVEKNFLTTAKVANVDLAPAGRMQIHLAQAEMTGLMELRRRYSLEKPLCGARIAGCLHMTVQTAVLIETLIELGAQVRWASSNPLSTQDEAAAALAIKNISVFAWKGMDPQDFLWAIDQTLGFPQQNGEILPPNMILDDGADLSLRIREHHSNIMQSIVGVSEQTTTGVIRFRKWQEENKLAFPVINVNDSVTKSKFDNKYGCKESLLDGIRRATDLMIAGKTAVVAGFGDVGKGCAEALKMAGCKVIVSEIDPICALQAAVEGYEVFPLQKAAPVADIIVTATGNRDIVTEKHFQVMKDKVVLCNIGHFDCEIDMQWLEKNATKTSIKPQVDMYKYKKIDIIVLAQGKLVNLGCATGHPSLVMSFSFCNQVLAQIELWKFSKNYPVGIHNISKKLDEEVARLHLPKFGAQLETLSALQATYIGVDVKGPYKPESYRY